MHIPDILTPRLTLRAFSLLDAALFHQLLCGEDVLRYFPRQQPPPLERVEKWIISLLRHWEQHGFGLWAVTRTADGELLGRCGLQLIPETGETEIDFLFGRPYWDQGYATEAGKASLGYGFTYLDLFAVVGIVHPENLASRHVLEKLGFQCGERTQYFGMDVLRYSLTREEDV